MLKKIQIRNSKGLLLSAIVEKPEVNGAFPTVLFLHGFKGYKEEATYFDLATKLLEHGIASIRFDASGFGDSQGTIEEEYRFSNYIADTEAMYAWMKQQEFVLSDKVGVVGQSMGGAQAILFSSNHPELQVVVAISPPDRIGTIDALGAVKETWKENGYLEDMSSRYGKVIRIPYAYFEDAVTYDFIALAEKIVCPTLVVLGEVDDVVLPVQTERVFDAISAPKKLLRFAEMDHFYKRNERVLDAIDTQIVKFVVGILR